MKKLTMFLMPFLLIWLLAACSESKETVDEKEYSEEKPIETDKAPVPLTLEEVLEKTAQATEDLNSFSMDMDLAQKITSTQEQETMQINSSIFMEVVTKPFSFYQKMKMEIPNITETMETESYFSHFGFYMHDPTNGTWMKFPNQMTDQLLQLSKHQTNPGEEIKNLQSFTDDISFEEKEDGYHLSLNASGEEFTHLIKETVEQTLPDEMTINDEAMQNFTIHTVSYDIVIDKETFFPKTMDVDINMELTIEDQNIQLYQEMKGEYAEYNNIEEITIPQEVMENAVEIEI